MEETLKVRRLQGLPNANEYHKDNYFICPYGKGWEYRSGFIPGIPLTRGPP